MGKPDALDRVAQLLVALAALVALANGLFMLVNPLAWYGFLPTVRFTGPYNPHFVRDIGAAYLASGSMLGWASPDLRGRWLGAAAGGLWLALHAGIHVYEVSVGICGPGVFWSDAPGVIGPPLLILAALGVLIARSRITPAGLPRAIILPVLTRMGDGDYIAELAGAPGHAFDRFLGFMPASAHRHEAPPALFHAARIGAVLAEDCGACAMIAARAALVDGVDRETVNTLFAGAGEGDLGTAFRFGQAIATQSAEAAALGDAIEATQGRVVRLELAMTASLVRGYPGIKRGMGYAQSCALTRLQV
jgi:hypothetical protein